LTPNAHQPARARRLVCVLLCAFVVALLVASPWLWNRYRANQEWRGAASCLAGHDLAAAATHLSNYVDRRPNDADGWFLAARTARRLERFAEAERYLERCQHVGGVTDSTSLEWDLLRVQQGEIGDIDVRLRGSIRPDHPDGLLVLEALARGYTRARRLPDALQACNLWLARQPEHPWPWLWRGSIYEQLDYLDKALPDYERAVELAPQDKDARLALGGLLLRQNKPGAAAEQYQDVLGRAPDEAAARLGLAACRIEEGRADEAVPLLDAILEQTPTSPRALFLRGKTALHQDQLTAAEHWLREAMSVAPHDPEVLHELSETLRARGKDEEASDLTRRAELLRKDYLRLDELNRTIARNPDDPAPRHEAGVLALRLGRTEEGLAWLQSALRLKGDHRGTHAVLRDQYREQGDLKRAEYHNTLAQAP
jgi:tetratricopeptide (TPR) repeat protein